MTIISNNLKIARFYYHTQQLNLIPIVYMQKNPKLEAWQEYQERRSTSDEIEAWFAHSQPINFGAVHGQFDSLPYYIAIDIDHIEIEKENDLSERLKKSFPHLFEGWLEKSGSGEGLHIPIWLWDSPASKTGRIIYNFGKSELDIRIHSCQTVLPPSVHPTGGKYEYIQKGAITELKNLDDLLAWCDENGQLVETANKTSSDFSLGMKNKPGTLSHAVLEYWQDCLQVFRHFGYDVTEQRSDYRILGQGGLLISGDGGKFFNHTLGWGGGPIQAWGYCVYGENFTSESPTYKKDFYDSLCGMATAAGINSDDFKTVEVSKKSRYFNTLKNKNHPILSKVRI